MLLFFSQLQTLQDQNEHKKCHWLSKLCSENLDYFSKKFKGISCPEHLFLALMKKILAWDSLQARLVGDGGKPYLVLRCEFSAQEGHHMVWWLGWSRWRYEEIVSNSQVFEGQKGAWSCKQETRVCRNLHCWRGFWSSYWVQKAVKSGCKGARVVAGNGQLMVLLPLQLWKCWKVWFGEIVINLGLAGVGCHSLVEDFSVLDTWISERETKLGEFQEQQQK